MEDRTTTAVQATASAAVPHTAYDTLLLETQTVAASAEWRVLVVVVMVVLMALAAVRCGGAAAVLLSFLFSFLRQSQ